MEEDEELNDDDRGVSELNMQPLTPPLQFAPYDEESEEDEDESSDDGSYESDEDQGEMVALPHTPRLTMLPVSPPIVPFTVLSDVEEEDEEEEAEDEVPFGISQQNPQPTGANLRRQRIRTAYFTAMQQSILHRRPMLSMVAWVESGVFPGATMHDLTSQGEPAEDDEAAAAAEEQQARARNILSSRAGLLGELWGPLEAPESERNAPPLANRIETNTEARREEEWNDLFHRATIQAAVSGNTELLDRMREVNRYRLPNGWYREVVLPVGTPLLPPRDTVSSGNESEEYMPSTMGNLLAVADNRIANQQQDVVNGKDEESDDEADKENKPPPVPGGNKRNSRDPDDDDDDDDDEDDDEEDDDPRMRKKRMMSNLVIELTDPINYKHLLATLCPFIYLLDKSYGKRLMGTVTDDYNRVKQVYAQHDLINQNYEYTIRGVTRAKRVKALADFMMKKPANLVNHTNYIREDGSIDEMGLCVEAFHYYLEHPNTMVDDLTSTLPFRVKILLAAIMIERQNLEPFNPDTRFRGNPARTTILNDTTVSVPIGHGNHVTYHPRLLTIERDRVGYQTPEVMLANWEERKTKELKRIELVSKTFAQVAETFFTNSDPVSGFIKTHKAGILRRFIASILACFSDNVHVNAGLSIVHRGNEQPFHGRDRCIMQIRRFDVNRAKISQVNTHLANRYGFDGYVRTLYEVRVTHELAPHIPERLSSVMQGMKILTMEGFAHINDIDLKTPVWRFSNMDLLPRHRMSTPEHPDDTGNGLNSEEDFWRYHYMRYYNVQHSSIMSGYTEGRIQPTTTAQNEKFLPKQYQMQPQSRMFTLDQVQELLQIIGNTREFDFTNITTKPNRRHMVGNLIEENTLFVFHPSHSRGAFKYRNLDGDEMRSIFNDAAHKYHETQMQIYGGMVSNTPGVTASPDINNGDDDDIMIAMYHSAYTERIQGKTFAVNRTLQQCDATLVYDELTIHNQGKNNVLIDVYGKNGERVTWDNLPAKIPRRIGYNYHTGPIFGLYTNFVPLYLHGALWRKGHPDANLKAAFRSNLESHFARDQSNNNPSYWVDRDLVNNNRYIHNYTINNEKMGVNHNINTLQNINNISRTLNTLRGNNNEVIHMDPTDIERRAHGEALATFNYAYNNVGAPPISRADRDARISPRYTVLDPNNNNQ